LLVLRAERHKLSSDPDATPEQRDRARDEFAIPAESHCNRLAAPDHLLVFNRVD